jgi:hypothetical protein
VFVVSKKLKKCERKIRKRSKKEEVKRGCVADCVTKSFISVTQVGGGFGQQVLNRLHILFQYHSLP